MIAEVTPGPLGWWVLALDVIRRDAPAVSGTFNFRAPEGWEARTDPEVVRVTADGWAAIEISTIDDLANPNDGVMVLDLLGGGGASGAIPGSAPTWLQDGTLLVTLQVLAGGASGETARRIPDHGFGTPIDLLLDDECVLPVFPFRYIVQGNGSGLAGFNTCVRDRSPMTLRWDGDVVPRDPTELPYLELGSERFAGAKGERVVDCPGMQEICELQVRRANGEVLSHPASPGSVAWTRDGAALAIGNVAEPPPVLRGSNAGLIRVTARGLATEPLARLPLDILEGSGFYLPGMSDWAAVFWAFDGEVIVLPLDGSPAIGPFDGVLAGVNP